MFLNYNILISTSTEIGHNANKYYTDMNLILVYKITLLLHYTQTNSTRIMHNYINLILAQHSLDKFIQYYVFMYIVSKCLLKLLIHVVDF